MSIRTTYKDSQYGQKLVNLERKGDNTLQALEDLRGDLPHLKTQIDADPDYTQSEKDAAKAEVDAVISSLVQDIKDFANSI